MREKYSSKDKTWTKFSSLLCLYSEGGDKQETQ